MFLTDNVHVDFEPRPEDSGPDRPTLVDWLLILGTAAMTAALWVGYVWHRLP